MSKNKLESVKQDLRNHFEKCIKWIQTTRELKWT